MQQTLIALCALIAVFWCACVLRFAFWLSDRVRALLPSSQTKEPEQ